jgi:hypothetical protein
MKVTPGGGVLAGGFLRSLDAGQAAIDADAAKNKGSLGMLMARG